MRTYTLIFSIAAHVTVACTVLFSTVLATSELPEPRRASVFVDVFPAPAPPPAPPRPRVVQPASAPATPVEAPEGVHPEMERPALPEIVETVPDGVVDGLQPDTTALLRDEPAPPPPATADGPVRVGGQVKPPEKIVHVPPVYPALARAAGIAGIVILETTVGEDGVVRDVRILRSAPMLDDAAVDAVRQWRFTPTLLNGRPVSVLMTVTVAFTLR